LKKRLERKQEKNMRRELLKLQVFVEGCVGILFLFVCWFICISSSHSFRYSYI